VSVAGRLRGGIVLSAMPSITAAAPPSWPTAALSPRTSQPVAAPITGSKLTKAPAVSAGTRACPNANSQNGSSVPPKASAITAATGSDPAGIAGAPSVSAAIGTAKSAPAASCTAVTAAASRPASSAG
jgi:hypothetical protein